MLLLIVKWYKNKFEKANYIHFDKRIALQRIYRFNDQKSF